MVITIYEELALATVCLVPSIMNVTSVTEMEPKLPERVS